MVLYSNGHFPITFQIRLKSWDIIHLSGGIYSSVCSTKTFLYSIMEPRYKQNNMWYQISRIWNNELSNIKSDIAAIYAWFVQLKGLDIYPILKVSSLGIPQVQTHFCKTQGIQNISKTILASDVKILECPIFKKFQIWYLILIS